MRQISIYDHNYGFRLQTYSQAVPNLWWDRSITREVYWHKKQKNKHLDAVFNNEKEKWIKKIKINEK